MKKEKYPVLLTCPKCGGRGDLCLTTDQKKRSTAALKKGCRFFCPECFQLVFNYRAIRDIVFLWPEPLGEHFIEGGNIVRCECDKNVEDELYGRTDRGIILTCGPGYYDSKKWRPTDQLPAGTPVMYNKNVPWRHYAVTVDMEPAMIVMCGYGDILTGMEI